MVLHIQVDKLKQLVGNAALIKEASSGSLLTIDFTRLH
jgi:hypothetical protein